MQRIESLATLFPVVKEDEIPRQLAKITERDEDLQILLKQGYVLTHTAAIAGPEFTTFVDTLIHTGPDE
ncbi:hypothetical protein [Curtobacterium flaccumfaciens]|uniref:hypothetical protein n=1 Tax=Curtobacterium flaccumfaciens TaxID=2035 RepID=UPI001BDE7A15|nr:hypothetical protein [Curtobacterium flaccumfaciens]MBT1608630.1 hypothetical protein [Curtobacterium flaccumfaciens pv. betae]MBT1658503.1 hypothetical protein [Curtobacterium flaccumfaciens pv. betae]MCS0472883.1 hypothetical protein [Curtobacterium flaccumfaciens pv. betae]MCS0476300.1 hypothetical protein [Curtobacterium flaccumfaciens pv. betae]MCS0479732.1 hypothetical protein [Curtobacterium flaccumfaciens pv. betae]